jgi:hypothetical protein
MSSKFHFESIWCVISLGSISWGDKDSIDYQIGSAAVLRKQGPRARGRDSFDRGCCCIVGSQLSPSLEDPKAQSL